MIRLRIFRKRNDGCLPHPTVPELEDDRMVDAAAMPRIPAILSPHERNRFYALVVAPDGKTLITTGPDQRICSWEIPSGRKLAEIKSLAAPAPRQAVSRDGRMLPGSPEYGGQIELWNLSHNPPTQLIAWK